ncbi:MAG: hypothetical protein ACPGUH_07735 [Winogradskyella sp.]
MGIIREPNGVDFIVDSRELKDFEKKQISDIISHYKKTGEIKKISIKKRSKKRELTAEK